LSKARGWSWCRRRTGELVPLAMLAFVIVAAIQVLGRFVSGRARVRSTGFH
jgi:hypothetical protein